MIDSNEKDSEGRFIHPPFIKELFIAEFQDIQHSVKRASLPFDFDMMYKETLKVSVYEINKMIVKLTELRFKILEHLKNEIDQPLQKSRT